MTVDERTIREFIAVGIRVLIALTIGFFVSFFFAKQIYNLLLRPYVSGLCGGGGGSVILFTAPQDYFPIQIRVALFGAFFVSLPLIGVEFHRLIAPGLRKPEKRPLLSDRIAAPLLFFIGAAVAFFVAAPIAVRFFAGCVPELYGALSDYLWLATALILAFGIAFQFFGLTMLARAGILGRSSLHWSAGYAIFVLFTAIVVGAL